MNYLNAITNTLMTDNNNLNPYASKLILENQLYVKTLINVTDGYQVRRRKK